jgi:hypothetical protein
MTFVDSRTRARCRIADTARAILQREVSYLDGARLILENRGPAELPEGDSDMAVFALIESETENLPFGSQRQHWSPEALERKAPEVSRAEEWARSTAECEARSFVRRFGGLTERSGTCPELDLVSRRAFFDDYPENVSTVSASLVRYGLRSTCPCCGYPTLCGRAQFEICFLCSWEDDGQDDASADDIHGGPNADYSLSRARYNFMVYGVMYEPENDTRIGGLDSDAEHEVKSRIVSAFEAMINTPASEHEILWSTVRSGERELDRLLKIRIRSAYG